MLAALHVGGVPATPADVWHHWGAAPSLTLPLALTALLYARGTAALWRRAGTGRSVSRGRVAAFAAGLTALAIALLSPLDPASEVLFSAHMVQHLLLILVAAPLLVAGAPERVVVWAFPLALRRALGDAAARVQRCLGRLTRPGVAVAVATGFLWMWHLPRLYDFALDNEAVHALEHVTFLLTAVLFWWTLLRVRSRREDRDNGARLLALFAMVVQGSLLGALLTFASSPLYASHRAIPEAWGVSPLADQQLAGVLMWVPPAALYLGVAAYLMMGWLEAGAGRVENAAG